MLLITALNNAGWVIVALAVAVQPKPSVTVTVYVLTHNDEIVPVPIEPLLHEKVNGAVPDVIFADALPLHKPLQEISVLFIVTDGCG